MRRAIVALALCALVGMTELTTIGAASEAKDQKLAEKAVLGPEDVPVGFDQIEAGEPSASPCEGAPAEADQLALDAPHATALFNQPDTFDVGVFGLIQSNVAVLKNTRTSKRVLNAFQDEEAGEACVLALFEQFLASPGVTNELAVESYEPQLNDKGNKTVIKGGDEYAGFDVSITRSQPGGEAQYMNGIVVLARVGRGVAQLVTINTVLAAGDSYECECTQDMLQTMVKRLARAR